MYLDTLKFLFVLMESEHVQGLRAVHEVCTPAPLLSLARAITVHAGFLRKFSLSHPLNATSPLCRGFHGIWWERGWGKHPPHGWSWEVPVGKPVEH